MKQCPVLSPPCSSKQQFPLVAVVPSVAELNKGNVFWDSLGC